MKGETSVALSLALEKHLKEQHELAVGSTFMSQKELERVVETYSGTRPENLDEEAKKHWDYVTRYRGGHAPSEHEDKVTRFSGVDPSKLSERSKNDIKYVTQYKKGSDTESKEECYVRTHSETMCKVRSQDVEELLAKVSQLKEQRRETCKLAPCFPCPLCGRLVEGDTENELSNDLKVHFIEDHDI